MCQACWYYAKREEVGLRHHFPGICTTCLGEVVTAAGHDFRALLVAREACEQSLKAGAGPVVLLAQTVKGNGVSHMRDTVDCHYLPLSDAEYEAALDELARAHQARLEELRDAG